MTETSIRIHTDRASDLAQIAELIARQNSSPRYRCLHSDEGSAEGVLLTMNKLAGQGSLAFVCLLGEPDRVVAAFVAEIDSDLRRGWLWGPFAEDGETDPEGWLAICEQMVG